MTDSSEDDSVDTSQSFSLEVSGGFPDHWGAYLPRIKLAIGAKRERRRKRALTQADAEGVTPEAFCNSIESDGAADRLCQDALLAAERTPLEAKQRALGRALAQGILATDDAELSDAEWTVAAWSAIEAPHLRLLHRMIANQPQRHWNTQLANQFTLTQIRALEPQRDQHVDRLLRVLEQHALVRRETVGVSGGLGGGGGAFDGWLVTEAGHAFVDEAIAFGAGDEVTEPWAPPT